MIKKKRLKKKRKKDYTKFTFVKNCIDIQLSFGIRNNIKFYVTKFPI